MTFLLTTCKLCTCTNLGAVLGLVDGEVQDGARAVGGVAAGLLDHEADGRHLVQQAQLGLGGRGLLWWDKRKERE